MSLPLTAKGTLGPVGTAGNPGSSFMLEMGREKWYQKQVPRMIRKSLKQFLNVNYSVHLHQQSTYSGGY